MSCDLLTPNQRRTVALDNKDSAHHAVSCSSVGCWEFWILNNRSLLQIRRHKHWFSLCIFIIIVFFSTDLKLVPICFLSGVTCWSSKEKTWIKKKQHFFQPHFAGKTMSLQRFTSLMWVTAERKVQRRETNSASFTHNINYHYYYYSKASGNWWLLLANVSYHLLLKTQHLGNNVSPSVWTQVLISFIWLFYSVGFS